MKVALIGNMNNVFFTALRYFRDLDMDAHLFMYQNEQELFVPENDTYYINKYNNFIHTLSVDNSGKGLLLANKKKIKKELKDYDFFIGCGVAPALFEKLGYQLDIFVPYSDEIELTTQDVFQIKNILKYHIRKYTINQQIKGIKNTTKIIASAMLEKTKDTIKRLNLENKLVKKYILSVYKEDYKFNIQHQDLRVTNDLVIFSNIRHHWKDSSEEDRRKNGTKGVDKLIIGYSKFVKNNPNTTSILMLFEYGRDVYASKELIHQLNIEQYVKWFPRMPRKKILILMKNVDIVVGSLSDAMFGGVGFEGLSCGKILVHSLLYNNEEYYNEMGHEIPFIMKTNSSEDLEQHLSDFIKNKDSYIQKSKDNKNWFDKYAGIGLAKEYKKIIEEIYKEKIK